MLDFYNWLNESSLRNILNVPQNPKWHPEGKVSSHAFMVRKSIDKAINSLQEKKFLEPYGPFQNIDFNLNGSDLKLLKLASWLHDIGKGATYAYNGDKGVTAYGHDNPEVYEKSMEKLGPAWKKMYNDGDPKEIEDLKFLISNHMKNQSKKLGRTLVDEKGKYINNRRVKLLLILWAMDRIGRGGEPTYDRQQRIDFVNNNTLGSNDILDKIYDLSKNSMPKPQIKQPKSNTNTDAPTMANMLKNKGLPYNTIKNALQNKFNRKFSDEEVQNFFGEQMISFKKFVENLENEGHSIPADIPLDREIQVIANAFKNFDKPLYVVGGAVRDYLFHQHDEDPNKKPYKPKDIDLSTPASPEEITQILDKSGIKSVPKGESFGVISAIVNKKEYEIASFRSEWYDPENGDGRRPDKVQTGVSAKADASRRDLTMNALFYDINNKKIVDFNLNHEGKGQGFEDIRNKVARPVGNARDRFREDKLRIPRLIRFFSRFNSSYIMSHLDKDTIEAIHEFKDLAGVSPERVRAEFLAGLDKCKTIPMYLNNYQAFNLLNTVVFPGLSISSEIIPSLGITRDPIVVLASLLRENNPENVRVKLNKITYPNTITDAVSYLIRLISFNFSPEENSENIKNTISVLKSKNLVSSKQLNEFATINRLDLNRINHMANYELPKINSQELMNQGFKDTALGNEIRLRQMRHYHQNYR